MSTALGLLGLAVAAARSWLPLLVVFALKATLLLAVALVVAQLLARSSAAARHLVLAIGAGACLALFGASLALPAWEVAGPRACAPAAARDPVGGSEASAFDPDHMSLLARHDQKAAGSLAGGFGLMRGWEFSIVVLWLLGALAVGGRLALGLAWAAHLGRGAVGVERGTLSDMFADQCAHLRLHRRVRLQLSGATTVPVTWGVRRNVVLLPEGAESWAPALVRAVLLHELAHVKRYDACTVVIARLACALLWFHPLCWILERRLKQEAERACDDLVLLAGLRPSDYAAGLLEVVGKLAGRRGGLVPGALAIVRQSDLEDRIARLLEPGRDRRSPSARKVACAVTIALFVAMVFGPARLKAGANEEPNATPAAAPQPPENRWSKLLAGGIWVEVVGVSPNPSGKDTWWGPDGKPLPAAPCDPANMRIMPNQKEILRAVAVRVLGVPEGASFHWRAEGAGSGGGSGATQGGKPIPGLYLNVNAFPAQQAQTAIQFEVAVGPWTTLVQHDGRGSMGRGAIPPAPSYAFGEAIESKKGTVIAVTHNLSGPDVRLVAVGKDGQTHPSLRRSGSGAKGFYQIVAEFDQPPQAIQEYQLQTRPYERVEIPGVALQPAGQ